MRDVPCKRPCPPYGCLHPACPINEDPEESDGQRPVEVELWTDGSGTTKGPIGFAWALVHCPTGRVREGQAGATEGTNNRAELLAVICGLRSLTRQPCTVEVVTDSEYVGKAYPQGWVEAWKLKRWRKVKNPDLWQRLDVLVARHRVSWRWVPGHAGVALNESCDKRAGECRRAIIAAMGDDSPVDALSALTFPIIDRPTVEQLGLVA